MTTDNLSIVQQALAALVQTGDVDALAPLLTEDFVHHRPDASATKTEWLDAVRAALKHIDGMQVEVQHVLASGDHVVMHSRRWLPGAEPGIVVVDVWRFDEGRIAEAWEIIEPVSRAAEHLSWWDIR
ncbi:nuclear transport factor 2 family protein [Nonomuraea typhae]|uniref:Nuclear transport factor 2 family protein n=1 Tax=Nonomuraea typhae TaxID=2603600 RepID=A0ABW7Z0U8_9ACTN